MHSMTKSFILPSLLSCNFANLTQEIKRLEELDIKGLHLDVMDGHFVKNFALGPQIIKATRQITSLFLDVHLMIYNPIDYIDIFVEAGANRITIHLEASEDTEDTLKYIQSCGLEAGLAFCPETSVSFIPQYLPLCDLLLLMTVSPGFGGQKFKPEVLEKISFAWEQSNLLKKKQGGNPSLDDAPHNIPIQVDGGITPETARLCQESGATELVVGSYLMQADNLYTAFQALQETL